MKHDQLPLPSALWERLPPEVQAAVGVVIDGYERRIAALEAEIAELKERLNQTSQNSSRPPSSDGPHVKRKPPKVPAGRKPGAQPGHGVPQSALVPLEQVSQDIAMPNNPQIPGSAVAKVVSFQQRRQAAAQSLKHPRPVHAIA